MMAEYGLDQLVVDLRRVAASCSGERDIVEKVRPLARRLALERAWVSPKLYQCNPETGFGVHLLHEEEDHGLAVFAIAWSPGKGVPPHNHGTWAVVAGVDGPEHNVWWRRIDDASRPGYAELEKVSEVTVQPGDVVTFLGDQIHSVTNHARETTLSLHIYGRHLNHTGRSQFNPERKTEEPFLINPQ